MARIGQFFSVTGFVVAGVALLGLAGCHKRAGFVGTWKTSQDSQGGSISTMTFNADQTMSFVATNGPKQTTAYNLSGLGTWKASDKDLTVTPLTMQLDGLDPVSKMKLQRYIQAQVNVPQTGPVAWKGDDEFVCTKNGVAQDFQRVR